MPGQFENRRLNNAPPGAARLLEAQRVLDTVVEGGNTLGQAICAQLRHGGGDARVVAAAMAPVSAVLEGVGADKALQPWVLMLLLQELFGEIDDAQGKRLAPLLREHQDCSFHQWVSALSAPRHAVRGAVKLRPLACEADVRAIDTALKAMPGPMVPPETGLQAVVAAAAGHAAMAVAATSAAALAVPAAAVGLVGASVALLAKARQTRDDIDQHLQQSPLPGIEPDLLCRAREVVACQLPGWSQDHRDALIQQWARVPDGQSLVDFAGRANKMTQASTEKVPAVLDTLAKRPEDNGTPAGRSASMADALLGLAATFYGCDSKAFADWATGAIFAQALAQPDGRWSSATGRAMARAQEADIASRYERQGHVARLQQMIDMVGSNTRAGRSERQRLKELQARFTGDPGKIADARAALQAGNNRIGHARLAHEGDVKGAMAMDAAAAQGHAVHEQASSMGSMLSDGWAAVVNMLAGLRTATSLTGLRGGETARAAMLSGPDTQMSPIGAGAMYSAADNHEAQANAYFVAAVASAGGLTAPGQPASRTARTPLQAGGADAASLVPRDGGSTAQLLMNITQKAPTLAAFLQLESLTDDAARLAALESIQVKHLHEELRYLTVRGGEGGEWDDVEDSHYGLGELLRDARTNARAAGYLKAVGAQWIEIAQRDAEGHETVPDALNTPEVLAELADLLHAQRPALGHAAEGTAGATTDAADGMQQHAPEQSRAFYESAGNATFAAMQKVAATLTAPAWGELPRNFTQAMEERLSVEVDHFTNTKADYLAAQWRAGRYFEAERLAVDGQLGPEAGRLLAAFIRQEVRGAGGNSDGSDAVVARTIQLRGVPLPGGIVLSTGEGMRLLVVPGFRLTECADDAAVKQQLLDWDSNPLQRNTLAALMPSAHVPLGVGPRAVALASLASTSVSGHVVNEIMEGYGAYCQRQADQGENCDPVGNVVAPLLAGKAVVAADASAQQSASKARLASLSDPMQALLSDLPTPQSEAWLELHDRLHVAFDPHARTVKDYLEENYRAQLHAIMGMHHDQGTLTSHGLDIVKRALLQDWKGQADLPAGQTRAAGIFNLSKLVDQTSVAIPGAFVVTGNASDASPQNATGNVVLVLPGLGMMEVAPGKLGELLQTIEEDVHGRAMLYGLVPLGRLQPSENGSNEEGWRYAPRAGLAQEVVAELIQGYLDVCNAQRAKGLPAPSPKEALNLQLGAGSVDKALALLPLLGYPKAPWLHPALSFEAADHVKSLVQGLLESGSGLESPADYQAPQALRGHAVSELRAYFKREHKLDLDPEKMFVVHEDIIMNGPFGIPRIATGRTPLLDLALTNWGKFTPEGLGYVEGESGRIDGLSKADVVKAIRRLDMGSAFQRYLDEHFQLNARPGQLRLQSVRRILPHAIALAADLGVAQGHLHHQPHVLLHAINNPTSTQFIDAHGHSHSMKVGTLQIGPHDAIPGSMVVQAGGHVQVYVPGLQPCRIVTAGSMKDLQAKLSQGPALDYIRKVAKSLNVEGAGRSVQFKSYANNGDVLEAYYRNEVQGLKRLANKIATTTSQADWDDGFATFYKGLEIISGFMPGRVGDFARLLLAVKANVGFGGTLLNPRATAEQRADAGLTMFLAFMDVGLTAGPPVKPKFYNVRSPSGSPSALLQLARTTVPESRWLDNKQLSNQLRGATEGSSLPASVQQRIRQEGIRSRLEALEVSASQVPEDRTSQGNGVWVAGGKQYVRVDGHWLQVKDRSGPGEGYHPINSRGRVDETVTIARNEQNQWKMDLTGGSDERHGGPFNTGWLRREWAVAVDLANAQRITPRGAPAGDFYGMNGKTYITERGFAGEARRVYEVRVENGGSVRVMDPGHPGRAADKIRWNGKKWEKDAQGLKGGGGRYSDVELQAELQKKKQDFEKLARGALACDTKAQCVLRVMQRDEKLWNSLREKTEVRVIKIRDGDSNDEIVLHPQDEDVVRWSGRYHVYVTVNINGRRMVIDPYIGGPDSCMKKTEDEWIEFNWQGRNGDDYELKTVAPSEEVMTGGDPNDKNDLYIYTLDDFRDSDAAFDRSIYESHKFYVD